MVHLRSTSTAALVAIPTSAPQRPSVHRPDGQPSPRATRRRSLQLVRGSLSARRVESHSPVLAGLHRASTGILAGLGLSLVGLSALSQHWQTVFSHNYAQLQASRSLEQKLQESAALLEQHHLGAARRPGQLVPTSSEKLIHIGPPKVIPAPAGFSILAHLPRQPMPAGY